MKKNYQPLGDVGAWIISRTMILAFAGAAIGGAVAVRHEASVREEIAEMNASYASIDSNPLTKNDIEVAPY